MYESVLQLLVLFILLAPSSSAPPIRRSVNWYLSSSEIENNAALIADHPDVITGGYLCCHYGGITANGSWSSIPTAEALAQMKPLTAAGREVWEVSNIAEAAVHSGAWARGLNDAVVALTPLAQAGLSGIIIDYEPDDNYTVPHALAFAEYLGALVARLAPLRLAVGVDIADWSILAPHYWPFYLNHGIARFTSMSPTYDATNVTEDRLFVSQALAVFPNGSYAAGVGSVLTDNAECVASKMDFNWTAETFAPFVQFMSNTGVQTIDVWVCMKIAPHVFLALLLSPLFLHLFVAIVHLLFVLVHLFFIAV